MRAFFPMALIAVSLTACMETVVANKDELPLISSPALASHILVDHEALSANGELIRGEMSDLGDINLNLQSLPTTSGYVSSLQLSLTPADVCIGKSIFGSSGSATCGITGTFADFAPSNMPRDRATTPMSLITEKTTSTYASGYREIPDVTKDDDGQSGTSVIKAARPTVTCGTTQATVILRIADCDSKNGALAMWAGSTKGNAGESTWKLVTRTASAKETWRDERTGFLWSDNLGNASWCRASGNAQTAAQDGTAAGICDPANPGGYNAQNVSPVSYCAEAAGRGPAIAGENWTTGVYNDAKGGMGKMATATSPALRWRLPSRSDWQQAEIDGLRHVLPNLAGGFWSTTVDSTNRDIAWYFYGPSGYSFNDFRDTSYGVRCIGR